MFRRREHTEQDAAEVVLERLSLRPPPWPKQLHRIRRDRFAPSFADGSSALARRGSWIVQAVVGGQALGYAWAVPALGKDSACYIEEVAVAVDSSNRGLGTELVRELAQWLPELGFSLLRVSALHDAEQQRREAWFLRMGFVVLEAGMYGGETRVIANGGST
jgi:GNAT superfamily N-acetyltransferase